jgi:hypothetical protein
MRIYMRKHCEHTRRTLNPDSGAVDVTVPSVTRVDVKNG